MKKRNLSLLIVAIIVCMLFSVFSTAKAAPLQAGAVVTPINGAISLQTKIVRLEDLPGTVMGSSGSYLPASSPTGDRQFYGDGIAVSGLTGGSASLCMNAPVSTSGWTGTLYKWTGSKWEKLATVNTDLPESTLASACSVIYSDGTYAMMMAYKEPPKPVLTKCTNIDFIFPDLGDPHDGDEPDNFYYVEGGIVYPGLPVGTKVAYQLLNITPVGTLSGSLSASGIVVNNVIVDPDSGAFYSIVEFPADTAIYYSAAWKDLSFTVRFFTQGCYFDFRYPDDLSKIPR